jgi:dynein heavy chain
VPELPPDVPHHELANDPDLVNELILTVEQWTQTIKETVEREDQKGKNRITESASKETEYWRGRAATFNTLNQQLSMPQVKQILDVMKQAAAKEACNMSAYNDEFGKFVKNQAVAKDFVKFLSTLERQFKNIQKGELQVIEETLPTLLTGLKLIWTISRHINHQEEDFIRILQAISTEICQKVKDKIQINKIFKMADPA